MIVGLGIEMSSVGAPGKAAADQRDDKEMERMMKELRLREEDLDDLVFDEKEAPPDAVLWIAVARVHSSKTYSQFWFFKNMRAAWDLAQEVKFKPLEANLYTIEFSCLGDWERVTLEGPWHFRRDAVIIKPYDGLAKPSTIPLDSIEIWVQIHDVPDLYAHLVPSLTAEYEANSARDDLEMLDAEYTRKRPPTLVLQVAPQAPPSMDHANQLALPAPGAPPSPSSLQDPKRAKILIESEKNSYQDKRTGKR